MKKKNRFVLFAVVSMLASTAACSLDGEIEEDEDGAFVCAEGEVLVIYEDGVPMCETEGFESQGNNGSYTYVGWKLGYRTYLKSSCASSGACSGFQYTYSAKRSDGCRDMLQRTVRRTSVNIYSITGRWKNTGYTRC